MNDDTFILHNDLRVHQVSFSESPFIQRTLPDWVRVSESHTPPDNVMLTINFLNITENEAGKYRVIRRYSSLDLDDSIHLKTIDEANLPKIAIAERTILNSNLVLECRLSNVSTGKSFWSVNGTMIGNHGKYYENNTFLTIGNWTADDQFNVYKCTEILSGIESDPYRVEIYGPDAISFNSSDKIIKMDEKDSLTISCFANCFPPCQIAWTETNAQFLISGAELKLVNVIRNSNYTCYATNARKDNATISDTIYLIVKSGISHYITTAITPKNVVEGLPSKHHILYILLGIGVILAVVLMACLLQKVRTCLRVNRVSNNNTDDRGINLQGETLTGNYWTIVSNADGELRSMIEAYFEQHREQRQIRQNMVDTHNESGQIPRPDDLKVNEELDGNLIPDRSLPVQIDYYIHPVHSVSIERDFGLRRELLIGQNRVYTHSQSEQIMGPDDVKINREFDGYLNSVNSCHEQLDGYIHPVHSDPFAADIEPRTEQVPIEQNMGSVHNESEQLMESNEDVEVNEELDGYLNPVHACPIPSDDNIHPVHLDLENTSCIHIHQSTEC